MPIARQRRKPTTLDMTPMIDCVFQLLIFFLLTSTFAAPSIRLQLPTAHGSEQEVPREVLVVSVDEHGACYLGAEIVMLDELPTRLQSGTDAVRDRPVRVRGDGNVRYNQIVPVLDAVRQAGATDVLLDYQPQ